MLHPIPKIVYSTQIVSKSAITSHAKMLVVTAEAWRAGPDNKPMHAPSIRTRQTLGRIRVAIARPPIAFFRLFDIGELVGAKNCAIRTSTFGVSGDGRCRDETQKIYILRDRVQHTNTSSMSCGSPATLFYRHLPTGPPPRGPRNGQTGQRSNGRGKKVSSLSATRCNAT